MDAQTSRSLRKALSGEREEVGGALTGGRSMPPKFLSHQAMQRELIRSCGHLLALLPKPLGHNAKTRTPFTVQRPWAGSAYKHNIARKKPDGLRIKQICESSQA